MFFLELPFSVWCISFRKEGRGGHAWWLNKIYWPHVIFKVLGPPCKSLHAKSVPRISHTLWEVCITTICIVSMLTVLQKSHRVVLQLRRRRPWEAHAISCPQKVAKIDLWIWWHEISVFGPSNLDMSWQAWIRQFNCGCVVTKQLNHWRTASPSQDPLNHFPQRMPSIPLAKHAKEFKQCQNCHETKASGQKALLTCSGCSRAHYCVGVRQLLSSTWSYTRKLLHE